MVRGRPTAAEDVRRKRQQTLSFLLRHGRIFTGGDHWTRAHRRWLAEQSFDHPAQQIVFQDGVAAIEDVVERQRRLEEQLASLVPKWSMAAVVAVTFAAEIGDVRRFDTPRQLMLVPAERSTGETVRRSGLTLAGTVAPIASWSRQPGATAIRLASARPCEFALKRPLTGDDNFFALTGDIRD